MATISDTLAQVLTETGDALSMYVEGHPPPVEPYDVPAEDYLQDRFMVSRVESGKLHVEGMMDDRKIVLSLLVGVA